MIYYINILFLCMLTLSTLTFAMENDEHTHTGKKQRTEINCGNLIEDAATDEEDVRRKIEGKNLFYQEGFINALMTSQDGKGLLNWIKNEAIPLPKKEKETGIPTLRKLCFNAIFSSSACRKPELSRLLHEDILLNGLIECSPCFEVIKRTINTMHPDVSTTPYVHGSDITLKKALVDTLAACKYNFILNTLMPYAKKSKEELHKQLVSGLSFDSTRSYCFKVGTLPSAIGLGLFPSVEEATANSKEEAQLKTTLEEIKKMIQGRLDNASVVSK